MVSMWFHVRRGKGGEMISLAVPSVRLGANSLPTLSGTVLAHPESKRGQLKEGGCPSEWKIVYTCKISRKTRKKPRVQPQCV